MNKHLTRALVLLTLAAAPLSAQVPGLLNFQGRVAVENVNFHGSGQFKFALVNPDGTTTYWSNDGISTAGSQPGTAVSLTVTRGLYSVLLGDDTLASMTTIPANVFANQDVRLRVWFDDGTHGFQQMAPDQRLAAVGYAMMADTAQTALTVPDGAITAAKIAAGAVGSAQLDSNLTMLNLVGTSFLHRSGAESAFLGPEAGNFGLTGNRNTATGYQSLYALTSGSGNTAAGYNALHNTTTGAGNTALGGMALNYNTSGDSNSLPKVF